MSEYPQQGQYQGETPHPRDQVPEYQPQQQEGDQQRDQRSDNRMLSRDEVDRLISEKLRERDEAHAEQVAKLQAQVPTLVVPADSGGPGNDNHLPSWSLADQEAARRGDDLEHWHG